jgi:hypothetical protein
MLLAVTAASVSLGAGPAWAVGPDAPWSGSGTATTTVTSDGTTSDPVFDYSTNGNQGSWTFSATARTDHRQPITWRYKGYHAWYQVRVAIEQFVIHNSEEWVVPLPPPAKTVNCCEAPSGGFDYTGSAVFNLHAGDVYGFRMTGSNADSDRRLMGTLSLTAPDDFSVTADPFKRVIDQGDTAMAGMLTEVTAGSAQPVSLSVAGLPPGATASFTPASITAGDFTMLYVTIGRSTPCGSYELTVFFSGSKVTHLTKLPLEVCNDFSIRPGGWIPDRGTAWTIVSTTVTRGSTQLVRLRVGNLPPSMRATFDPPVVMAGQSSKLTVVGGLPCGKYPLDIVGEGRVVTRTTPAYLVVPPIATPGGPICLAS